MQKELGLFPTEKVMTVKEVASALGVSKDTILNCIKRILPNKLEHGKTTFLNEREVACISKELKTNCKVTEQLTVEAGSTVKNTTTDLEITRKRMRNLSPCCQENMKRKRQRELQQSQWSIVSPIAMVLKQFRKPLIFLGMEAQHTLTCCVAKELFSRIKRHRQIFQKENIWILDISRLKKSLTNAMERHSSTQEFL